MRAATEFVQFDRATDQMVMLRLFGHEQSRFCGPDERLIAVFVPRVFPRTGDSLTLQYKLIIENRRAGSRRELLLCGVLNLNIEPQRKSTGETGDNILAWPDMGLYVTLFPFDAKLTALQILSDPQQGIIYLRKFTESLGWSARDITSYSFDVLGYRLERRAVLRLRIELLDRSNKLRSRETVICRIVRPDKIERLIQNHQSVIRSLNSEAPPNRRIAPEIIAVDNSTGAYFLEEIPGASLCDLTGSSIFAAGCRAARRHLAKLQEIDHSNLTHYTNSMETAELGKKVNLVGAIFPEISAKALELTEQLVELSSEIDFEQGAGVEHRDFYDKQVIVFGERVCLLDFDSLSIGDRAQDVGNFLGHCQLRQLQEPQNCKNIAEGAQLFSAAVEPSDKSFSARVVWWQAATLIRLGLIYALRPRWRGISADLLDASAVHLRNLSSNSRIKYAKTE